MNNQAYHH